jgi:hypothetical protein
MHLIQNSTGGVVNPTGQHPTEAGSVTKDTLQLRDGSIDNIRYLYQGFLGLKVKLILFD